MYHLTSFFLIFSFILLEKGILFLFFNTAFGMKILDLISRVYLALFVMRLIK